MSTIQMPKTMRAVAITAPGAADVLQVIERPVPECRPGEILIRVAAAGVNRPDVLQRKGMYPPPAGASDLPGLEVAGTVVGGDLASCDWKLGDEVCALVAGGGYAEYCAAPAAQCLPVPSNCTLIEAASLPETHFTVWSNVFDRARLGVRLDGARETLLVQGGTSGIGVTAIQMARAFGHRVFATAGSEDKARACEALGAERGINYRNEDFAEVVRASTDGIGVDVVLDMVGGHYVPREINALADDGRIVLIALIGGAKSEVDLAQVLRRRLTLTGSTLRAREIAFKAAIAQALRTQVWPLYASRAMRPVVYRSFPVEQASEAHRLMEASEHIGKIVLTLQ